MDWWRGRLRMGQRLGRIFGFWYWRTAGPGPRRRRKARLAALMIRLAAVSTAIRARSATPFSSPSWSSPPTSSAPTAR